MRQLKSEWIKFRSLKINWWFLVIMTIGAIVGPFLYAFSQAEIVKKSQELPQANITPVWDVVTGFVQLFMLFALILVVLTIVQEYQYGTIQVSLFTEPNRSVFFLTKLVFGCLITTVIYCLTTVIGFIAAFLGQRGYLTKQSFFEAFSDQAGFIYGQALMGLLLTVMLIVGISFLFKSSTPTILSYFLVFFVVNNILLVALMQSIGNATTPNLLYWIVAFSPAMCLDVLMKGTFNNNMTSLAQIADKLEMPINSDQYFVLALVIYATITLVILGVSFVLFKTKDVK
jgi:ABC-2 type transport system permease protein